MSGYGIICGGSQKSPSTSTSAGVFLYMGDAGDLCGGNNVSGNASGFLRGGSGGIGGGGGGCKNSNNNTNAYGGSGGDGIILIQYLPW